MLRDLGTCENNWSIAIFKKTDLYFCGRIFF